MKCLINELLSQHAFVQPTTKRIIRITHVSAAALPSNVLPSVSTGNPCSDKYSRDISTYVCHSENTECFQVNTTTTTNSTHHYINSDFYINCSIFCCTSSLVKDIKLPVITHNSHQLKLVMDINLEHLDGCSAKTSKTGITCSISSGSSTSFGQMVSECNTSRTRHCGRTFRRRHDRKCSSFDRAVSCDADPGLVSLIQWIVRGDVSGKEDVNAVLNGVESLEPEHCGLMSSVTVKTSSEDCGVRMNNPSERMYMQSSNAKRSLCSQRSLRLKAALFPETGRGLMALKYIAAGEILVSIPREFMINCQDVLNNHTLRTAFEQTRKKFTSIEILAVFLLYNKALKEKSPWIPYISSLPLQFSLFSDVGEASYYPKFIAKLLVSQLKNFTDSCSSIKRVCQCLSLDATDQEAGWAFMAVNSRTVYLELEGSCSLLKSEDSGSCALAPYLDLINHSHKASVNVLLDKSDNCYKIITNVPYKRHQEVFINYGPHDNASLFVEYGFYLPNNPHDGYPISVDDVFMLLSRLPLLKTSSHHHLLGKLASSLEESKNMFLAKDGPSWSLEAIAAILLMPAKDLSSWQVVYGGVRGLPHYPKVRCLLAALITETVAHLEQKLQRMKAKEHGSVHFKLGCGLVEEYLNLVRSCKVVFEQQG